MVVVSKVMVHVAFVKHNVSAAEVPDAARYTRRECGFRQQQRHLRRSNGNAANIGAGRAKAGAASSPPTKLLEKQVIHPAPPIFSVLFLIFWATSRTSQVCYHSATQSPSLTFHFPKSS